MAEARSSKLFLSAFIAAIVAAVSIIVVVLVVRSRGSESGLTAALGSSSSLEELLAAPSSSSGSGATGTRGLILEKASLKDAIEVARPRMENTVSRLDVGSALLTLWASKKMTWDAIQSLPETSPLQFRKDPEAERGKRLCMSGVISSIRAEKTLAGRLLEDRTLPLVERTAEVATAKAPSGLAPSPLTPTPPMPMPSETAAPPTSAAAIDGLSIPDEDWTVPDDGKVFFVTLEEKPQEAKPGESAVSHAANLAQKELMVVEVVAVRSTKGLVDGSDGRACGVLTGVTLPYLENGEAVNDVPQHRIVGLFDLPDNRAAPGGESH
jgi:hypothetical protein